MFDMGFNFRATSGFVTDPAYCVPALGEAYPHTYTNANGDSIVAGTVGTWQAPLNRNSGNDPRIAGMYYQNSNGSGITFRIDLDSGSNPGPGTYDIDFAGGDPGGTARLEDFKILDDTTLLIDGTNGGAGIDTTGSNMFIDATLSVITGGASWTGTKVSKVFASNICIVKLCNFTISGLDCLSHFRLTQTAAGGGGGAPGGAAIHYRRLMGA